MLFVLINILVPSIVKYVTFCVILLCLCSNVNFFVSKTCDKSAPRNDETPADETLNNSVEALDAEAFPI
jgi:hypothetical protein